MQEFCSRTGSGPEYPYGGSTRTGSGPGRADAGTCACSGSGCGSPGSRSGTSGQGSGGEDSGSQACSRSGCGGSGTGSGCPASSATSAAEEADRAGGRFCNGFDHATVEREPEQRRRPVYG